ncbi:MAG: hypothetical protein ACPGJS_18215 [Flammeovirgaceae bacterium]
MGKRDQLETHPLFPSGDWEGFFTYELGPQADKYEMELFLNFKAGVLSGGGDDEVGIFSWRGTYDVRKLVCRMVKDYQTHKVQYKGNVDENGIWGTWKLDWMTGGFHIWPKLVAN